MSISNTEIHLMEITCFSSLYDKTFMAESNNIRKEILQNVTVLKSHSVKQLKEVLIFSHRIFIIPRLSLHRE